jgi:antitoxin YefM
MPKNTFTISKIREIITDLPERFEQEPKVVTVTRNGKPIMAILAWEMYESIMETLEVLGDVELIAAFRQGVKDLAEGRVSPWEEVKKDLGWD